MLRSVIGFIIIYSYQNFLALSFMKQKTKYFVDKIAPIFMAAIKQELIFPFI